MLARHLQGRIPPSAVAAGCLAALIGFGSTVALIVEAARPFGASPAQVTSAVTALCIGMAVGGPLLSLWLRMPIVLAWSTPGAALLGASALGVGYAEAVAAYVTAAGLTILLGLVPALGRLVERIPAPVAAGMLAGVLLPFCLNVFTTLKVDPLFAGVLLAAYIAARQLVPTYALLIVLGLGIALVAARGQITGMDGLALVGSLEFTRPAFDWRAMVSLGVPLFLVTLVSQNLPGIAVLRSAGYHPPARPLLLATGAAWLVLAPFGALGVNLAAITAALCTGEDAHPDREQRYVVGVVYGLAYVGLALFSAPLVGLFTTMPRAVVMTIAGIALLGPLTNALVGMLSQPEDREAAILTFAATASGVSLLGIGAAFWGLVAGFVALAARKLLQRARRAA